MLSNRGTWVPIATVLVVLLAAPASFGEDSVKIGFAHVFSGAMATFGEVARQGAELAVKEINAKGGVSGRKLELVFGDTAAKPDVGKAAVEQLVRADRVSVVIGIVSSAVAKAVTPLMNELRCPLIITHAMLDEVTGSMCNPWTFRMTWNMDQCYRSSALLAKSLNRKSWTTVGPDYGFGQDSWKYFVRHGSELGGLSFVDGIFTPLGTKDYGPVIEQLRQKQGVDGLMLSLWGNDLREFIRQAHQAGFLSGKTVLCPVGGSVEIFAALGFLDMPEGIWFGSPYWYEGYDTEANTQFIAMYKSSSLSEIPPSYAAYNAYAAVKMFAAAVEKAGSSDPVAVAKALSGLTIADLPVGPTTFRPEDHQAIFDICFGRSSSKASTQYRRIRSLDSIKIFKGMDVTRSPSEDCKMVGRPQ
jgi:branched-chain amino acid transport system substrate-binding protein